MTIKQSLPLPNQYNSELAYWVTRVAELGKLNRNDRIRIIETVRRIK